MTADSDQWQLYLEMEGGAAAAAGHDEDDAYGSR